MGKKILEVIKELNSEELGDIVSSVYGMSKDVDERIEFMLLKNNSVELAKQLKKRIQSIKREQKFIGYREGQEFVFRLDGIVDDIASIVEGQPKIGFELIDLFISTHEGVYNRSDDSNGIIGDCYTDAVSIWIIAASLWRKDKKLPEVDWQARILENFDKNEYAVWDSLLPNCHIVLTVDELKQLAWRFENEARQAVKNSRDTKKYNVECAHASIGLSSVARALGDVGLYERSVLIGSPEPNSLQKANIAEFCLSVDDASSALKWLEGEWEPHRKSEQQRLLDNCYQMLGQLDSVVDLRREIYSLTPSYENLQDLLEVASEEEQGDLLSSAVKRALAIPDLFRAVEMLIKLGAMNEAELRVLENSADLSGVFYTSLIAWASSFTKAEHYLPAILCYRALLEDILNGGRSTAYKHAAKYYNSLKKLDAKITDYKSYPNIAQYNDLLWEKHSRKYSFWERV